MVTNQTLAKIVVFGGFGACTAAMFMKESIESKIKMEEYYREAFKQLRAHEGVKKLLGEPIKDKGFDLGDKDNMSDGYKAFFKVKVAGAKDKGTMSFWAERLDVKTPWNIKRIELELKDRPEKRLLVKKDDDSH